LKKKLKELNSILGDTDQNNFEIGIGNFGTDALGLILLVCCFRHGDGRSVSTESLKFVE
jgi:hypothetical protein